MPVLAVYYPMKNKPTMKNYTLLLLSMLLCTFHAYGQTSYSQAYELSSEAANIPYFQRPAGITADTDGNIYIADSEANRIKKYNDRGQFLLQWGITGDGPGQLDQPLDVATDTAGNILVADSRNSRIQRFSASGDLLQSIGMLGSGTGSFFRPQGIAVGPDNAIYVADNGFSVDNIQKLTGNGFPLFTFDTLPSGPLHRVAGIVVDARGNVLVADAGRGTVEVFNDQGQHLMTLDSVVGTDLALGQALDMEVSSNGDIYIIDNTDSTDRIVVLDSTYSFLRQQDVSSRFTDGRGIGVAEGPLFYISDQSNGRIFQYDTTLTLPFFFGRNRLNQPGQLDQPSAAAFGTDGFIYVADAGNQRIQVIDTSGVPQSFFGSAGDGMGSFQTISSIEVDTANNLYVLDSTLSTVQKLLPNGSFIKSWGKAANLYNFAITPDGTQFVTFVDSNTAVPIAGFQTYDALGAVVGTAFDRFGDSDEQLLQPYGIARDDSSNIYLTDYTQNYIYKYAANGQFRRRWGGPGSLPGQFNGPTDVEVDHQGHILVVDRNNHRLQRFSSDGQLLEVIGQRGSRPLEFNFPVNIDVNAAGQVLVADAGNNRLQVLQPCSETVDSTAAICQGETFTFYDRTLVASGTYQELFTNQEGCDSIVELTLIVQPRVRSFIDTVICPGDSVVFQGQTYFESGAYFDTLQAQRTGCDSILALDLIVAETFRVDTAVSICADDFLVFAGDTLRQSGQYLDTLSTEAGCDSIIDLQLTVLDTFLTLRQDTICQGDTLRIDTLALHRAGQYRATFPPTDQRCDSIVDIQLTVLDTFLTLRQDTICEGDTLRYQELRLFESGNYRYIFPPTEQRCDSTVDIQLSVLDTFLMMRSDTICGGDVYPFGERLLSESGRYRRQLSGSGGRCDSILLLDLTVLDQNYTLLRDTICAGDIYTFDGDTLRTDSLYTFRYPSSDPQCDSVVQIDLTVKPTFLTQVSETICAGDTLFLGGVAFTESGNFNISFPENEARCDSTVQLELTVLPRFERSVRDSICAGDSLLINGIAFEQTGDYQITFPPTSTRCDSIINLQLIVTETFDRTIDTVLCQGNTLQVGDQQLSQSGELRLDLQTQAGCDSSITYRLQVLDTFQTRLDTAICAGERFEIGNTAFMSAGQFVYTFPANGKRCDSIVEIDLRIKESFEVDVVDTICRGETLMLGDLSLDSAGQYQYTFPENEARCDSTVRLDLHLLEPSFDTMQLVKCPAEVIFIGDTEVTDAGAYDIRLTAANGCDSLLRLNVTTKPPKRRFVEGEICEGDSLLFGGTYRRVAGNYFDTLQAADGCDSIVALELTVNPVLTNTIFRNICAGEVYAFGDRQLSRSGTYQDTFTSNSGCPFILELELQVGDVYADTTVANICEGDSIRWQNGIFRESGLYENALQSELGCDSIQYLLLNVTPLGGDTLQTSLCPGDSILLGEQRIVAPGLYTDTLQTDHGCDSIVVLDVQQGLPSRDTLVVNLCSADQTYPFGDLQIDSSGVYEFTFTNRSGCDSTVLLDITFNESDFEIDVGGILLSARIDDAQYQWIDCRDTSAIPGETGKFFIPERNGSYAVAVVTDSCSFLSQCVEVNVTNAQKLRDVSKAIDLYPNPVEDELTLELPASLHGNYRLQLFSMEGRLLKQERRTLGARNRLSVQELPSGMYWIRLQHSDGRVAQLRFARKRP